MYFKIPEGKKLIGDSGYKGEPSKLSTTVDEHSDKVKEFFCSSKITSRDYQHEVEVFQTFSVGAFVMARAQQTS